MCVSYYVQERAQLDNSNVTRSLTHTHTQSTCLWRRALLACTETTRVVPPSFAKRLGVEISVAQGLINRLDREGYVRPPAKGKRWVSICGINVN